VVTFENQFADYLGVEHAVAVSSGTSALQLALMAEGVGAGDEVITTPFTFVATVNAIIAVGARPVFVDIDPVSFNISVDEIESAITPRTKAILPVHLFGNPAPIVAIKEITDRYNLKLVEDAAQAHGSEYFGAKIGGFGTGCFSFYPTKNMTCAEGGMVTTNNPEVAKRVRLLRNHGMLERYKYHGFGFNLRMSEIHAAIGLVQLPKLDSFNTVRQRNAAYLTSVLSGSLECPKAEDGGVHVYNQFAIRVKTGRELLKEKLTAEGIGSEIYYPSIIPTEDHVRESALFPRASKAADEVLSLPIHPGVSDRDLKWISSTVLKHVPR